MKRLHLMLLVAFGVDWLLQRQISIRLETLLVRSLVVKELTRFNRQVQSHWSGLADP